eukprot:gene4210-14323_t
MGHTTAGIDSGGSEAGDLAPSSTNSTPPSDKDSTGQSNQALAVALPIVLALIAVIAIVVGIIWWKRRRVVFNPDVLGYTDADRLTPSHHTPATRRSSRARRGRSTNMSNSNSPYYNYRYPSTGGRGSDQQGPSASPLPSIIPLTSSGNFPTRQAPSPSPLPSVTPVTSSGILPTRQEPSASLTSGSYAAQQEPSSISLPNSGIFPTRQAPSATPLPDINPVTSSGIFPTRQEPSLATLPISGGYAAPQDPFTSLASRSFASRQDPPL